MFRQQSFNNMIIIVATTLAAVAGFVSADSSSARIIRPASSNSNKYSGNYYRPTGVVHQSTYDNSDNYYDINGQFAEGESSIDQILDKNFEAPPVATATTGGLPFISYALRGIAWLFVVGTRRVLPLDKGCRIRPRRRRHGRSRHHRVRVEGDRILESHQPIINAKQEWVGDAEGILESIRSLNLAQNVHLKKVHI